MFWVDWFFDEEGIEPRISFDRSPYHYCRVGVEPPMMLNHQVDALPAGIPDCFYPVLCNLDSCLVDIIIVSSEHIEFEPCVSLRYIPLRSSSKVFRSNAVVVPAVCVLPYRIPASDIKSANCACRFERNRKVKVILPPFSEVRLCID